MMNWDISKEIIESFIKNVIFSNNDFGVDKPKAVMANVLSFLGRDKFASFTKNSSDAPKSLEQSPEGVTKKRSGTLETIKTSFKNVATIPTPPGEVVKSGYLTKKGAKRRNWNYRWFVLKEHNLIYYKDQKDFAANREPYGIINLQDCYVSPIEKKMFEFMIGYNNTDKRDYFIYSGKKKPF